MWLFAILLFVGIIALSCIPQTRASRSLWGQLAVLSFPFFFLFMSALASPLGVALRYGVRPFLLAISTGVFFLYSLVMYMRLYRKDPPAKNIIHPLLFAVAALYVVLQCIDLNVSPIWDAGLYFGSVLETLSSFEFTFSSYMSAFSAQSHSTQALLLFYVPAQYLFPGSVVALNLTNMTLSLLILFAYYRLMQRLFPDARLAPVLCTALFVFMPQHFAFVAGVNPDYGVLAGFVFLLYAFFANQRLLTVAAALLLIFSKETGIMLYGGFGLGVLLFMALPKTTGGKKFGIKAFVLNALPHWPLLLPLAAFFLQLFTGGVGRISGDMSFMFDSGAATGRFGFQPLHMLTILNQIFLLNFNWVLTLIILAGLAYWVFATSKKNKTRPVKQLVATAVQTPAWGVAATAILCYLLFCLFYIDFPLPRYNLAIYTCLPPLAMAAVHALPKKGALQTAVPSAFIALQLLSCYVTVDPASIFAFPYSHSMGDVTLLEVTNHTNFKYVCERHIYNRQYLNYSRLMDDIIGEYGVESDTFYVSYDIPQFALQFFGNFEWDYRLGYSPAQNRRVFFATDAVPIPGRELFAEELETSQTLPDTVYWIALPYQDEATRVEFTRVYAITGEKTFSRAGLQATVYTCEKRP